MSTIRAGNTTNTALTTTGDTTGQLNLEADSGIINTGSVAGGIILPSGTTAQRPTTPLTGMLRFNTTNNELEVYTAGWLVLASRAPTIVAVSPVTYNGESGTSFTITGTNFIAGAQVYFIDSSNVEYAANSVVVVSSTSITMQTPQDFTVAQEPLKLKIVQSTGTVISPGLIDTGNTPAWTTASGNIGTIYDSNRTFTTTIVAVDTDSNSTLVYSLQSGSLPTGLSLNTSTGVISGTVNAVATDTTSTFTIRATDNAGNTSDRQFNIVVKAPVSVVYNYSGATTTFTVPTGVTTLTAKLWGGGGGNYSGGTTGGGGGYSTGSWTVSAGQSYIISVGGAGGTGTAGVTSAGGFGGGGAGGVNSANSSVRGGGGGGYSGIFINSVSQANAYLIAGGGGGAQGYVGGAGGGSSGVQGSYGGYAGRVEGGYGGTQSAGGSGGNGYDTGTAPSGSALQGGAGGDVGTSTWNAGGGGGGGYFGGGGGAGGGASTGAGGGGSGYVRSGVTGSTTAGSGATAANSGDSDRAGNAGNNATNGLIILKY